MTQALRALFCWLLLSGWAWAQPLTVVAEATVSPEQQRAERARLAQARAAQLALRDERELSCRRVFWVNDCMRQAQLEHRRAMNAIDKQQTQLEQAMREQRAREVAERLESRMQDSQQRQAGAPDGGATTEPARLERTQSSAAQRQAQARERMLKQEQRELQASERAQRRERAAQAAQVAQAARLERHAQRTAGGGDEAPP